MNQANTSTPEQTATVSEVVDPMLVQGMRRHPDGIVEHLPATGPKTGTSTRGFLAEYEEAITTARAAERERILTLLATPEVLSHLQNWIPLGFRPNQDPYANTHEAVTALMTEARATIADPARAERDDEPTDD